MDTAPENQDLTADDVEQAQAAVGTTPEGRARWLLNFPHVEEEKFKLRPMRVECAVFLGEDLHEKWKDTGYAKKVPRDEEVRRWKRALIQFLDQLRAGEMYTKQVGATLVLRHTDTVLTIETTLTPFDAVDKFIVEALKSLIAAKDHFQFCGNEMCRCAFIRNRRQMYCSPRCSDTVNHRKYRRALKAKLDKAPE